MSRPSVDYLPADVPAARQLTAALSVIAMSYGCCNPPLVGAVASSELNALQNALILAALAARSCFA
ncbi:hypothetical protein BD626DRAFT_627494, partial [Schizophyllum amplum]